jgi:hybrid cluster-associated redox disulfide protein
MERYRPEMLIRDVLTSDPRTAAVFEQHGLGCPMCMAAEMDTLASVATMHDIAVDVLLDDLNSLSAHDYETT